MFGKIKGFEYQIIQTLHTLKEHLSEIYPIVIRNFYAYLKKIIEYLIVKNILENEKLILNCAYDL